MSDLIDRQALIKQIEIDSEGEPGYYGDTWKFMDTIKNLPSAESETIRCKDCKWFERHEEGLEYFGRIYDGECNLYCQEESQPFDEDGFCSNAERRTE